VLPYENVWHLENWYYLCAKIEELKLMEMHHKNDKKRQKSNV
jgi:hypothetical protein